MKSSPDSAPNTSPFVRDDCRVGVIIMTPPHYSLTGARNREIGRQLSNWAVGSPGVVTDSSTGFVLPSGARRRPDAAWTSHTRLRQLWLEDLTADWHLCPDFVIELRSRTDRLEILKKKMKEYLENGVRMGVLIEP